MIEYLTSSKLPSSHLPFSPATALGNMLFVSGQASVDENGNIVSDTFEGEMRRSMENLRRILEENNSFFGNILQLRAYVDDPKDLPEFNRIYADYFEPPYPARTTLTQCFGGILKFEVDCIALRHC